MIITLTRQDLSVKDKNLQLEEISLRNFCSSPEFHFQNYNVILFVDGPNIKILKDRYNVFGQKDVEKQIVQAEYFKDSDGETYIGYKILNFVDRQSLVYIPPKNTKEVCFVSLADENNVLSDDIWANPDFPGKQTFSFVNNYIFKTDNLIDPKIKEAMDLLEKNGYSVNKIE